MNSSPGIIMVARSPAKRMFLPLNSRRANAKADRIVITSDRTVEMSPTIMVLMKSLPRLAAWNASA